MIWRLAIAFWLLASTLQAAPYCAYYQHKGKSYTMCEIVPEKHDLRLFLNRADGLPHGSFTNVDKALSEQGLRLSFAMNAGMYHADRSPVGLYVEEGVQAQRLITTPGPGNFGMLPNGVFCVGYGRADVIETLDFEADQPDCLYASQSGPMLVIDGALHPRFLPDSDSVFLRNGVGTSEDGSSAVFVMANEPVTFHDFGTFFRDVMKTPNALYFDGNISKMYAPSLGRSDLALLLGPIVGVVESIDGGTHLAPLRPKR